jgi:hypothetical protein
MARLPLVRTFAVPTTALREVATDGVGLRVGERLVMLIEPDDLATSTEAALLAAVKAVIKRRRKALGARPTRRELEIYRLRTLGGMTPQEIVKKLDLGGADSLRYVRRVIQTVTKFVHEGTIPKLRGEAALMTGTDNARITQKEVQR